MEADLIAGGFLACLMLLRGVFGESDVVEEWEAGGIEERFDGWDGGG